MDIEALEFRAACLQAIREFFITQNYLELDTPALSQNLIPESCLEVFKTEYIRPLSGEKTEDFFLVPSPEVFIKPVISDHGRSVFQVSKCYRNSESFSKIHRPEFTMLEYYTVNANYIDSLQITESFFKHVVNKVKNFILADNKMLSVFVKDFLLLKMDDAFFKYAGFRLSNANAIEELAKHAERLGLGDYSNLAKFAWDDLYEMILVHCIEPNLPKDEVVVLIDCPAKASCLAVDHIDQCNNFLVKERWEMYINGTELANCYTEERAEENIEKYFENEAKLKQQSVVPHPSVDKFGHICSKMPPCSGVAMGVDRFIMLLAGKKSLDSFVYKI